MAKESLIIEISEKGALVVKRNLSDIGSTAKKSQGGVGLLTKALAALGGALIIKQLIGVGDAFTLIQNRLRLVTTGTAQLNVVTKELLKLSNNTRSSLETNADLFNRLSLSTTQLGVSQRDLLDITKSLNQAVTLSGASTAEASAGLTQLSQGLASGALRGDELRSVLEQLPAVADVIAKEMGVTRGELRKFGSEGKITAEIVINAFKNAREELQERFNKTVPTVGQAFVVLRNQVTFFIGELDKSFGATSSLASLILVLANNVEILGKAAVAAGIAISTVLVGKGISAAIGGVKALGLAIRANPIGLLVTGVIAAGSALVAFQDNISLSGDGLVTLGDTAKAVWSFMGEGISAVTEFLGNSFAVATDFVSKQLGGVSFTFEDLLAVSRVVVNSMIGTFVGLGNAVGFIFKELAGFINDAFGINIVENITRSFKAVVDFGVKSFKFLLDFGRRVLGAIGFAADEVSDKLGTQFEGASTNKAIQGAKTFGSGVAEAFNEGFGRDFVGEISGAISPALEAVGARARKISNERIAAQKLEAQAEQKARDELSISGTKVVKADTGFAEILKGLEQQKLLLGFTNREAAIQNELLKIEKDLKRELIPVEEELIRSKLENLQALQTQAAMLEEIKGPQQDVNDRMAALSALLKQGKIDTDEFNDSFNTLRIAELETGETFGQGIELGLRRMQEEALTTSQVVAASLESAFGSASDALANFVITGKASFKSLAQSILADITRIITKKLVAEGIKLIGFAHGGSFVVGGGTAQGFAHGGEFNVGGIGSTDSQTVAFNATPGETVSITTPQQQAAMDAGSGQQTIVAPPAVVKIINVVDPDDVPDSMESPRGEQVIMNIISRNPEAIKRFTS